MRRLLLTALLLATVAAAIPAQAATWVPDQAHSEVEFSILHMSLSNVRGRFGNVSGTINFDPADVANSTVNITIDVSAIDTGESARDAVLKSASFFDVENHPSATFVSTKVEKTAGGLAVMGNLTLRGVTRPVVLTVEGPNGPVTGMDQKLHAGFTATTSIDRKDFGIGASFPSGIIGDQVKLSIDLEIVKQ
jgi:polyisoprenoid-binding protein YceI